MGRRKLENLMREGGFVRLGQRLGSKQRASFGFFIYDHTSTNEWWIHIDYPAAHVDDIADRYMEHLEGYEIPARRNRTYIIVPKEA